MIDDHQDNTGALPVADTTDAHLYKGGAGTDTGNLQRRGTIGDDIPQPTVADEDDKDADQDDTGIGSESPSTQPDGGTDIPGMMPDQPTASQ